MLIAEGLRVSYSGSRSISQNCAQHSARHSGLPQTSSALDIPWSFRGAIMAPLCSPTGLVGPVPKGKWQLSWKKPGLAHRNQTWNANQMNGSIWFSSSNESASYKMCCKDDVHCGLWHWLNNTVPHCKLPPRKTVNAAYYCTFLQFHLRGTEPHHSSWQCKELRTSCAAENGRFWNIHRHHPICDYDLFAEEPLRGTQDNKRDELMRTIGRWIRNINTYGRPGGVWRLQTFCKRW